MISFILHPWTDLKTKSEKSDQCKIQKNWCTVTVTRKNKAPRWTFTDSCKPEVRPDTREESSSPAWLAAPAMNVSDTTKVYIWRLDAWCGPTLYRKCHRNNTQGKRHNNTWLMLPGRSLFWNSKLILRIVLWRTISCWIKVACPTGLKCWYPFVYYFIDISQKRHQKIRLNNNCGPT